MTGGSTSRSEQAQGLVLPQEKEWARHVYHLYVVRCRERDALQRHLAERGVGTLIHYPIPVHLQECYADLSLQARGSLPTTERCAKEILSLPMYPDLSDESIEHVAEAVTSFSLVGAET